MSPSLFRYIRAALGFLLLPALLIPAWVAWTAQPLEFEPPPVDLHEFSIEPDSHPGPTGKYNRNLVFDPPPVDLDHESSREGDAGRSFDLGEEYGSPAPERREPSRARPAPRAAEQPAPVAPAPRTATPAPVEPAPRVAAPAPVAPVPVEPGSRGATATPAPPASRAATPVEPAPQEPGSATPPPGRDGTVRPGPESAGIGAPVAEPSRTSESPKATESPKAAEPVKAAEPAAPVPDKEARPAPAAAAQTPAKPPIRLFGMVEFRSPLKNVPKWERVYKSEQELPTFGAKVRERIPASSATNWLALREHLAGKPVSVQMKGVNNFFNQWPYKSDLQVWKVEDYWATPAEFIRKSGDCEDYAIVKYYALRDLGVPAEKLRIVALRDTIRGIGHAVLVVFTDDNAYVLDNLSNLILPHTKLTHYVPIYSVNEAYRWAHVKPLKQK